MSTSDAAAAPPPGATRGTKAVSLRGAVVGHDDRFRLGPVDLDVAPGELVAVVGPNGAGKSTLVRALLGLTPLRGGTRTWAPGLRKAFVPQLAAFDPIFPMRAIEVVLMGRLGPGLRPGRWTRADLMAAQRALGHFGVEDLGKRPFRDLSGGQKQKVLVARAFASSVDLYVFDEPTAALDHRSEGEVMARIQGLAKEGGAAVVLVTHLMDLGLGAADRVVLLAPEHEGALVGRPDEIKATEPFRHLYGIRA